MLRLLRLLLTGDWHIHRWALEKTTTFEIGGAVISNTRHYRCCSCGETKTVRRAL